MGKIYVRKNTSKKFDKKKYQVVVNGKVKYQSNDIGSARYNANYYRMKVGKRLMKW